MKRALFVVACAVAFTAVAEERSLREALHQLDYHRVVREVEAMPEPSLEARAFLVLALTRVGAGEQATRLSEELRTRHAESPWSWYAALALTRGGDDPLHGATMLRLAGDTVDEEMARLYAISLGTANKRNEALAFLDKQTRTPRLMLARAQVLQARVALPPAEVGQLADEVLAMLPDHVEALAVRAAFDLEHGRTAQAIATYQRAVRLSPSISLHRMYWTALAKDKSLTPERRAELLDAATKLLIEQRGETPPVLSLIAEHHKAHGDPEKARAYADRLLREAPASVEAQKVLAARLYEDDESPEAKQRMRKAAEMMIAWPHPVDRLLLAQAHQSMFLLLQDDETTPAAALLRHIEGMQPLAERSPHVTYVLPALALADRGAHLAEAERLARAGMAAADDHFARARKRMVGAIDDVERHLRSQRGAFHEALGWVLFQRGRFPEAGTELRRARELTPNSPTIAHRLGRYYESQRLFDEAEEQYRAGMLLETPSKNPNGDALKALYEKRHGSLQGWETYLASMRNTEAVKRRQTILGKRLRGRATPPFTLRTLDGKTVSMADLKGKVAVINFWGIWCGWCVKEMPDLQQLAQKYANDKEVVILTINNDDSVDKVKKWMAEKKYSFPVLLDEAFAAKHVRVYPTTWFIDPMGELAFEKQGWTEKLLEEFSWRIEALR